MNASVNEKQAREPLTGKCVLYEGGALDETRETNEIKRTFGVVSQDAGQSFCEKNYSQKTEVEGGSEKRNKERH